MSSLKFTTISGQVMNNKGGCFTALKSHEDLVRLFNIFKLQVEPLASVEFMLDMDMKLYSRLGKRIMLRYISKLLQEPSIGRYKISGTTPFKVMRNGLDLPLCISGSAIYTIMSLLRYVVEYPAMVMTIMAYSEVMDFDRALYLAHFTHLEHDTAFSTDVPDVSLNHASRPVNHSVINPSQPYKGGYLFLRNTLPVMAKLGAYQETFSYGNIQGITGITNREEIKLPDIVNDLPHAAKLSEIL